MSDFEHKEELVISKFFATRYKSGYVQAIPSSLDSLLLISSNVSCEVQAKDCQQPTSQHSVYAKFYSSVVPELGYPFNRKSQDRDIQTFQGAEGISFTVPMQ